VKNRNAETIAQAVIIAMFAIAIMSWSSAPAQIPIHWDISGQVDAYGSKFTGLLLLPIIALAGYTLIGLTAVFSPAQFQGRAMSALSWFRLAYVLVMAGVFGVIVADVRGANLDMNHVIFPLLALMMVAVGNLLVQTNKNKSARKVPPGGGIQV
jgi:immunity protein, SdpI family